MSPGLTRALVVLCAVLVAASVSQAAAAEIPAEARAREAKLLAKASPAVKTWVREEGRRLAKAGAVDEAKAVGAVKVRFPSLGAASDGDVMALAFLVMMEAAKSAQEDLKAIMGQVKAINAQKAKQRTALQKSQQPATTGGYQGADTAVATRDARRGALSDRRDSLSEVSAQDQLRLQMATERRNKTIEMLSTMLKKASETHSAIIGNLK